MKRVLIALVAAVAASVAAAANTATAEVPKYAATYLGATIQKTDGASWKVSGKDAPDWIIGITLKTTSGITSTLKSGSTAIDSSFNLGGDWTFEYTVTENTTGKSRSWTTDLIKDYSTGTVLWTLTLTQLAGSGPILDPDPDPDPDPVTSDLKFGPGKYSTFEADMGNAVVVGVKGLTWDAFADSDGYGATCFVNDAIVDAEKTAVDDDDDYWCGPITDMNLLYLTGWAGKTKYAKVDDMVDYFRANPKQLRYAKTPGVIESVVEGKYGYDGLFKWFKDTTKTDLSTSTKSSASANLSAKTLATLMGKGDYVAHIDILFLADLNTNNPKWGGRDVTHAVTCCGYEVDPEADASSKDALTGLFIIDSDNDQYSGDGGRTAPNSIVYCPVYWDDDMGMYGIYGVWGEDAWVYPGYTALKMNPDAIKTHKLTVVGGYAGDYGQTSVSGLDTGDEVEVFFDDMKMLDANDNEVNAFAGWTWTPAGADLGEGFNPYWSWGVVTMPAADVKLTANYVNGFAAYITMPEYSTRGPEERPGDFYWSVDGGKTLIPFGDEYIYPVKAGTVTVKFYDKSGLYRVPADRKLTVPKRATYKKDGVTRYEEPAWIEETATFISIKGSAEVAFDANGGKASVAKAWFIDGEEYVDLPVLERSGYKFDGWWTAKTGGDHVYEGDTVDLSALDAKKPTLYAHWLKAYTLTLKGTDAMAYYEDADGGLFEGAKISVLQGDYVAISAPDSYTDKKGVEYVFQQWSVAKAADFGTTFTPASSETDLLMPAADVTLTATYVKADNVAYLTANATAWTVYLGEFEVEPPFEAFQWSLDGKNWHRNGMAIPVDAGTSTKGKSVSVQWRSLSEVWAAPSGKTSVKVVPGDEFEVSSAAFSFVEALAAMPYLVVDGECVASSAGGTVTMNPKDGKFQSGKAVTLTAKANKGYAFVGWTLQKTFEWGSDAFLESTLASHKVGYFPTYYASEEDYKVHYMALFRATDDYDTDEMERVFGVVQSSGREIEVGCDDSGTPRVDVEAVVGCELYVDILSGCNTLCLPLTFKTGGKLPSGVKFDSKEGFLSGTPTTKGAYTFTVTAADPAGHKRTLTIGITVSALPSAVAGEYRGLLMDANTGIQRGLIELSVTSAGKVSGKIVTATGSVSVKPTLSWYDGSDPDDLSAFQVYYIKQKDSGSKGGSFEYMWACLGTGDVSYETETWTATGCTAPETSMMQGIVSHVDASILADKDFKAAFFGKYYTAIMYSEVGENAGDGDVDDDDYGLDEASNAFRSADELAGTGYLTLTVDKKGGVKVAGKLADGAAISASGTLVPFEDGSGAYVYVFNAPSAYKKAGYAAFCLVIGSDGIVGVDSGTWVVPPLYAAPSDEFTGMPETLPGLLSISGAGTEYSAFSSVEEYYLGVMAMDPGLQLEYTYTDSDKTKVYKMAEAVSDFSLLGEPEIVLKNNKITVAKSPKVWKDSEGYYHYEETKEDKNGNTQAITNPSELSMSFTKATGVVSGKFNVYFDYETPKYDKKGNETMVMNHKAVSVPYAAVVVRDGEGGYGGGSGQYTSKFTLDYTDAKGKAKTTTYSKTWAVGIEFGLGGL